MAGSDKGTAITPKFSTASLSVFAVLAALSHFAAAGSLALILTGAVGGDGITGFDSAKERALDVAYIKEKWAHRQAVRGWYLAVDLCSGFAWAAQLPVLLYLSGSLARQHPPLASCCQAFFMAGSLVCVIEFLLNAGTQTVGAQIAREYQLSDYDWKSFEISYQMQESRNAWLFATDWLFMALGFITLGALMRKANHPRLSSGLRVWATCSIILGVGATFAFMIDVARQTDLGSARVPLGYVLSFLLLGLTVLLLPLMCVSARPARARGRVSEASAPTTRLGHYAMLLLLPSPFPPFPLSPPHTHTYAEEAVHMCSRCSLGFVSRSLTHSLSLPVPAPPAALARRLLSLTCLVGRLPRTSYSSASAWSNGAYGDGQGLVVKQTSDDSSLGQEIELSVQ